MADNDLLRRYLDAGIAFTQMTQKRAEAIVRDLVRAGEVQAEQAQQTAEELLTRSRESTDRLVEMVRGEVTGLGVARKDDLAGLERRLDELAARMEALTGRVEELAAAAAAPASAPAPTAPPEGPGAGAPPASTWTADSENAPAGPEETPTRTATAEKAAATRVLGKKATAKKATAKKATARKTAAKKATATKAGGSAPPRPPAKKAGGTES